MSAHSDYVAAQDALDTAIATVDNAKDPAGVGVEQGALAEASVALNEAAAVLSRQPRIEEKLDSLSL
jgi:hypothetical protein